MPKVTVDGTSYSGINTVNVGGKSLSITQEYSGNKAITANGTGINVEGYSTVSVNVPASGITPSGTLNINANGTYDATNYASVKVDVPTGGSSSGGAKMGSVVVSTGGASLSISTGLSSITGFFVYANPPSDSSTNGTYFWCLASMPESTSTSRGRLGYKSGQYSQLSAAISTSYFTTSGGTLTVKQYSSYPIQPETYYWVAW